MNNLLRCLGAILLVFFFQGEVVGGDKKTSSALDKWMDALSRVRTFGETAISPDGKSVAWVEGSKAIQVIDWRVADARPRPLTAKKGKKKVVEHDIAWAPDSGRLAFLSDSENPGQLQIYIGTAMGGEPAQVTHLKGFLARPRWSPNGKQLAFLFTENVRQATGPVHPGPRLVGVIEEQVDEQRLAVVDLASGKVRLLSPADFHVHEYDWSPDGKSLAVIASQGSGDNNWYIAGLYTLEAKSGLMKKIWKPRMQLAMPRWSPDGKSIALIAGLMSDEGVVGGDIFVIPAGGGKARNLTPGMKSSASWLAWLPVSKRILFTEHVDGGSGLATLDPIEGGRKQLWKGDETFAAEKGAFSISLAADEKTSALIRHSFHKPPEVWAGPLGTWKQLTRANAGQESPWGQAKSLHWKSDTWTVQGWLLPPRGFDPKKRYPMLVSVHGGPASARRPAWPTNNFDLSILASQGFFVFFPNPRGSFGQGEDFTRANVKDFGHGDLRDILAGVDEVLKQFPVDPDRLGIAGWSYGGYMTMWSVTQTNRFRAAIAGAGIANWQSYYGQNGIDQWLIPFFGASVYDDPAVYARSSPINFIKRVKTPTLILVGERDRECPVPQSQEFWHALKTFGVPTQFVVYPGEGHLIAKQEHRRDIMRRTLDWLNRYVQ